MKLQDFPEHYSRLLPQLDVKHCDKHNIKWQETGIHVVPLFVLGYWDGPLSGIIKLCDTHYYVAAIYEEDRHWWAAWEIEPEDLEIALVRNRFFQQYVGNHTNYFLNSDGEYEPGKDVKPRDLNDGFYKLGIPQFNKSKYQAREIFAITENPFYNR